jgi:hypothetical protein
MFAYSTLLRIVPVQPMTDALLFARGFHAVAFEDVKHYSSVEKQLLADYGPEIYEWRKAAAAPTPLAVVAPEPVRSCRSTSSNDERAVAISKQIRRLQRRAEAKLMALPFQARCDAYIAQWRAER